MIPLNLLFPIYCLGCQKEGKQYFCNTCLQKVSFATTMCPVCKRFSFYGQTHSQCLSEDSLNGLISLWKHTGVIRSGISQIKYKFSLKVVSELAFISSVELPKFHPPNKAIVIPIPLSSHRQNWRGFNQADEIGKVISERMAWEFTDLLFCKFETLPQAGLTRSERLKNINGKMRMKDTVIPQKIKHTRVFLFDDVWTTGATIKDACRKLKREGFMDVWGLTIARA